MNRVCSLQGTNIGVQPTADRKFHLRLTVDKMHAFAIFTKKYLRSYGSNGTNFTTAVNCSNRNTEVQNEFIEIEIMEAQICL